MRRARCVPPVAISRRRCTRRSAIKPLQALALIETGAAAAFSVSEEEIALASASHSGEPDHVRLGEAWLDRLGLTEGDLACGAHRPMHGASARALVQAGVAPGPLHNNCSGKHLALLTTALHLGEPVADYVAPEHPAQRRLRDIVGELAALDLEGAPRATDGCSIPTIAVPLRNLARALAQLADPAGLAPARAAAARRITAAMAAHPYLVAGSGRYCSAGDRRHRRAGAGQDRCRGRDGGDRERSRARRRPQGR